MINTGSVLILMVSLFMIAIIVYTYWRHPDL